MYLLSDIYNSAVGIFCMLGYEYTSAFYIMYMHTVGNDTYS
jgi:hypothetical protein